MNKYFVSLSFSRRDFWDDFFQKKKGKKKANRNARGEKKGNGISAGG
ncbi:MULTISPECIES: hypothetical protein [Mucilaginibacter]|uniref:Uncharacterized protein n=1 Tax=Mucilaginibacter rubeus TaxID=2027860 RepID=A0ABX7UE29_9SPHI|nr:MULTISPECIES: hypothetical protein [Mucilaginibacter]QTE44437.1 hypothetical protein J3L19_03415 [Mucilaginibacter rubeus]QTE51036.1 hypothetical protein J3L21_03390 [Mucilaginibacter rubeus]QTE56119.1 hypothetical protein J3L23_28630 [Mucilaginibacter rubeus]QTE64416.1 hypothetical protein J3L22_05195 [Mucilaginibacter rubeus]QTF63177.1 hypothetical protein J3L20_04880 [Mucilaginibacter rubeus]